MRYSLFAAIPTALLMVFVLAQLAFADTVSNYVDLTGTVSSSAAQFALVLPNYILAGLGIFVSLVLFRFGIRLLRRWVH